MAEGGESKSFAPKEPPQLNPPKDTPISNTPSYPTYVAIKGTIFDVSGNTAYAPGGSYHVFAGKDPSRALALSSLKPEDCRAEWEDLPDDKKKVLDDWFTFFSKRYNIVGRIEDS
ncbi:MAG: hypothetical protein Q9178_004052 [Gyalolechia marmorata]